MKFYYEMLDKLHNGVPFKFSRWGDGEWLTMMGFQGQNRDGNNYTPELREALIKILYSEPQYYMGLQYGVLYNEQLRKYVFSELFFHDKINWVFGDVLHVASELGLLRHFTDALKDRSVVVIGADYFHDLPYSHIKIPEANSYPDNREILREVDKYILTGYFDNGVVLVAAAMNSNVIIDKLPDTVTAIDIGSVFDPYLGRPRASYQHKMNVTLKDLF